MASETERYSVPSYVLNLNHSDKQVNVDDKICSVININYFKFNGDLSKNM